MSRFPLSGLRGKALLIGLLPAVVMSLLIGGYLIDTRLDDLHQALRSRGQALANELAAISVYGLFSGNTTSLNTSARSFLELPDIASITIRSSDNSVLIRRRNQELLKTIRLSQNYRLYRFSAEVAGILADTPIEGSTPDQDTQQHEPLGSVQITVADRSLVSLQRELLFTALVLFVGGILLTTVLALIMSQRIVRPIISLSDAVKRLQQGDLSARVEQDSHDEIGILEAGFNKMAERVAMTQEELTTEIDQAVSDLQATMDALEVRNIELDLARKKALKASQVKSDFLAIMSHEIRTPMNAIIGFARLLGKTELSGQQTAQLKAIRDSADNLLAIINDVLDFSKLESGQISFHAEPFRLRPLVNGVITLFTPQAGEKDLQLRHMVYDDVPDHVIGDSLRIRQVLINLLGNAIKFTTQGSVTLRVMLDGDEHGDLITFSVQDTGIGLTPETMDRLFQPFTQADISTDRRYGGTGLGLSISKKLVEGMQGEIGVDSKSGEGSTFWFTLPLPLAETAAGDSPLADPAQGRSPGRSSGPIEGLRILLADDNPINLELAHAILSSHGARLTTARTGQEVLALANEKVFDLILMDVHMPLMNGIEASRQIRASGGPNSETPIIAITADVMAENQQRIFHAGMNEVLLKPIDEERLIRAIGSFFSIPAAQQEPSPRSEPEMPPLDALDQLPVRDLDAALSTAAGDRQIADKLFGLLLASLDQEFDELVELQRNREWGPLREQVHNLLGASAACGVPALHATLKHLQISAKAQRTEIAQQMIERLARQIEALNEFAQRQPGPS